MSRTVATRRFPCGLRAAAYRLPGSHSCAISARILGWRGAWRTIAPAWSEGEAEFAGHLLEHLICRAMLGLESAPFMLEGRWYSSSAEVRGAGTPGQLADMADMMMTGLYAESPLTESMIDLELARIDSEPHYPGVPRPYDAVKNLLPGEPAPERCEAIVPDELRDRSGRADLLSALRHAWVKPENTVVIIAGPHAPDAQLDILAGTLNLLPEGGDELVEVEREAPSDPSPQHLEYMSDGSAPSCTVYAWRVPWLSAYRAEFAVFLDLAADALHRNIAADGLACATHVFPTGLYVCGVTWSDRQNVDECLKRMRSSFMDTARVLMHEPDQLRRSRRITAKEQVVSRLRSPLHIVQDFLWMRALYPESVDPFRDHIGRIARLTTTEMSRSLESYLNDRSTTTIIYR